MSSNENSSIYSFWNGKNLKGTNEYFDHIGSVENCNEFKCVEGTETVCADEL